MGKGLYSFFSAGAIGEGFLLVGLKTYNCRRNPAGLCCFGLLFIRYIISYLIICSILLLLVLMS